MPVEFIPKYWKRYIEILESRKEITGTIEHELEYIQKKEFCEHFYDNITRTNTNINGLSEQKLEED